MSDTTFEPKHPRIQNGRHMFGWKKGGKDPRDKMLPVSMMGRFFMPAKVDLRQADKMPRVEDQGAIGSCTANASTSAVEYLSIKQKHPVAELSRLFLYYASRVWTEGVPASEDAGCVIRDVMKTLVRFGVCHESTWPYNPAKMASPPTPPAITEAKKHVIVQYWRCPSLTAVKTSLAQGYPVVFGFQVPSSIDDDIVAKTGIVAYPKPNEEFVGGHAVLAVGYDNATQLICFENSWGQAWGDKGYGYLPYRYFTDWLADDCWTIRAAQGA